MIMDVQGGGRGAKIGRAWTREGGMYKLSNFLPDVIYVWPLNTIFELKNEELSHLQNINKMLEKVTNFYENQFELLEQILSIIEIFRDLQYIIRICLLIM